MPAIFASRRPLMLGGALVAIAALVWVAATQGPGVHAPDGAADPAGLPARPGVEPTPDAAPGSTSADAQAYEELERHLQRQPRDGRALVFKARLDAQAGRFELAAAGYAEALRVAPRVARDPGVWVEFAEARGMAQGGSLLGEPEQLVQRALSLDSRHTQALDLAGSAAWERRQYAQAAALWQRLLAQLPPQSERHAALAMAIDRAELRARTSLPPGP